MAAIPTTMACVMSLRQRLVIALDHPKGWDVLSKEKPIILSLRIFAISRRRNIRASILFGFASFWTFWKDQKRLTVNKRDNCQSSDAFFARRSSKNREAFNPAAATNSSTTTQNPISYSTRTMPPPSFTALWA